jgi:predicted Zn finger-like uncharacterized protein
MRRTRNASELIMPETVRCADCDAALRIPDHLLGKKVKCPKCQTTFTAEVEGAVEEIEQEPVRPSASRRPRVSPDPEEEDEAPPEEEEEERPRRGRRRRSTAAAESAVTGPAICLMCIGGFGILVAIAYVVMQALNVDVSGQPPPSSDPSFQTGYQAGRNIGKVTAYFWGAAGVLWGILLLVGGLRMKQLKNYGLVMTTNIFAMVPCNCCCLIGLPIGIWGLTVLNRPQVKNAFS